MQSARNSDIIPVAYYHVWRKSSFLCVHKTLAIMLSVLYVSGQQFRSYPINLTFTVKDEIHDRPTLQNISLDYCKFCLVLEVQNNICNCTLTL